MTLHDAVGVDVEHEGRIVAALDLARRFFTPREAAELSSLPPEQQRTAFLRLWTLKEAFLKALGVGLAKSLDGFSFSAHGRASSNLISGRQRGVSKRLAVCRRAAGLALPDGTGRTPARPGEIGHLGSRDDAIAG